MLRYMTAGESHGKSLVTILEGIPRGVSVDENSINAQLKRRRQGFGRGARMKIESDKVNILSGIRKGKTTGSPIALTVENKDKSLEKLPAIFCPRPGHADLAGMLKFNVHDARDILERASARETAMRVAVGSICRQFLQTFGIDIFGHIKSIGPVRTLTGHLSLSQIKKAAQGSQLLCADKYAEKLMEKTIDEAIKRGDTLGGVFEIIAMSVPAGLGSCMQHDRKLDAILASELISIQAIKGVSFGIGFEGAYLKGSLFHDSIYYKHGKFARKTNNAGGIEGGMSNGEPIRVSCFMKPISTLMQPLSSINIKTKNPKHAAIVRSDVCALSAATVVGENVTAIALAGTLLEKFGGDCIEETKRNYQGYIKQLRRF